MAVCSVLLINVPPDVPHFMASDTDGDDLRRLYLDWCSARVARRFLELSHDEVWLRSHFATSLPADTGDSPESAGAAFLPLDRIPDYLDLVRKTTLVLAREMNLPSFAEWRVAYAADPHAFDAEMLGG